MCFLWVGNNMDSLKQSRYLKKGVVPERDICKNRDIELGTENIPKKPPLKNNPSSSKVEVPRCFSLWE